MRIPAEYTSRKGLALAYRQGYVAGSNGWDEDTCPYGHGGPRGKNFHGGYVKAFQRGWADGRRTARVPERM
jgi:ribosome modulation factor